MKNQIPPTDYSSLPVLVADDFVTMRRILVSLLHQSGFTQVSEAEDGAQAFRQLENGSFKLVVSDWNMPNMTGLELLKAVRISPKLKNIPFLLVTAEAKKTNIIDAAQAGADGYIVKPFSASTFSQKISTIFQRRALLCYDKAACYLR